LPVQVDDPHTCCFATQEKAWTQDRDGVPWELYTVTEHTENFGANIHGGTPVDTILPPVDRAELLSALNDPDVVVIDAQGSGGWETRHLTGAVNFGMDNVLEQAAEAISAADQRVIVYCTDSECLGAEFIGTQLVEGGYNNVGRFPGGVAAVTDSDHVVATRP